MHPLSEVLLLTLTVLARKASLESTLCAFNAIVIEPVTAVHTVAVRYDRSYFIVNSPILPF